FPGGYQHYFHRNIYPFSQPHSFVCLQYWMENPLVLYALYRCRACSSASGSLPSNRSRHRSNRSMVSGTLPSVTATTTELLGFSSSEVIKSGCLSPNTSFRVPCGKNERE